MMNEVGELTEKNKVFVAVCHALLNGMPGNGHETQRRPRRVASLVIPFGGILCYKHWKMAFFSYGTMPLHASTDAEHEFMNCLVLFSAFPPLFNLSTFQPFNFSTSMTGMSMLRFFGLKLTPTSVTGREPPIHLSA